MTLMFGLLAGLLCGALLGFRRWTAPAVGLIWYVLLAMQTAYLAHVGQTGFFGVNGLEALQGHGFAQYWIAQPIILALMAACAYLGARLRHAVRRTPAKVAHTN